jgi:hypothetical protein
MRSRARNLARVDKWPEENATSLDAAKLATCRLLWLQRQTRRAVRGRHRDAAVLLARSSVESCVLGFYCLHQADAPAQLNAANLKALRDMLRYLEDLGLVPGDVIDQCLRALGQPRRAPDVKQMAQHVDQATSGGDAISLYRNLYVPTSNFFAHGAGGLLRHVSPDGKVSRRPARAWARRSPARVADACAALLAAGVAQRTGADASAFTRYANRHIRRALSPLAALAASGYGRSAKPSEMIAAIKAATRLGTYIWSGEAARDTTEIRALRIRQGLTETLHATHLTAPPGALEPLLDHLADKLTAEATGSEDR